MVQQPKRRNNRAEREAAKRLEEVSLQYITNPDDVPLEDVLGALDDWLQARGTLVSTLEVREVIEVQP